MKKRRPMWTTLFHACYFLVESSRLFWVTADKVCVFNGFEMVPYECVPEYMLSKLISENDDESTIAVVTHGGMINQLYRAYFRLPLDSDFAFKTGDTGIHEWIMDGNSRILARANYIPHNI